MASKITQGPFKGYYTLPGTLVRERIRDDVDVGERELYDAYRALQLSLQQRAGGGLEVYYRYSPGPNKSIQGFNRSYLPYIDGFYYVKRDPQIDLRRQLFALENKLVPESGNTEVFNINLNKVVVPADYCPHLIDPCPDELVWCKRCKDGTATVTPLIPEQVLVTTVRWGLIALFCFIVAGVLRTMFGGGK